MSGSIDYDPDHVFEIDWEARRWQAAVAAMQGHITYDGTDSPNDIAAWAVKHADRLIAEYRKTEAK